MIEQYKQHNNTALPYYPATMNQCMMRGQNSYLIGPEGELYKCIDDIGHKEFTIGNLHTKDQLNSNLLAKYLIGADPLDDPKCTKCFYLPICGGGCPRKRLRTQEGERSFDTCTHFKGELDTFLEIHYEIKKQQQLAEQS